MKYMPIRVLTAVWRIKLSRCCLVGVAKSDSRELYKGGQQVMDLNLKIKTTIEIDHDGDFLQAYSSILFHFYVVYILTCIK